MNIDIESYYRNYGPMVLRRCRSILREEEAAVDAMQETFVRIIRSKDRLEDRAPSSLLYTTATHVCLNQLRKNRRNREMVWGDGLDQFQDPEQWEKRLLDRHFLERLFSEEAESTRTMAYLHYVDGFTLAETAEQTGFSVSGVRKRLRKLNRKGLSKKEA